MSSLRKRETAQICPNRSKASAGLGAGCSRFYQEYPFQISLNGSFHNLGRFLEKVGQCEQIINVTNIVIKGVDGDPNPGTTVRVRMTSSTFVMENPGSNPEKEAD